VRRLFNEIQHFERSAMVDSFEGKVALVTGAAGGIGLATARAFGVAGASVVVADSNTALLETAAAELRSAGHEVLAIGCDVTDRGQVNAMIEQAIETTASVATIRCSGGSTRLTNPHVSASLGENGTPDRISSLALRSPIARAKFCFPPAPGMTSRVTSVKAKLASALAFPSFANVWHSGGAA
jgi:NAD(P)-dependent dehydrogenase (short-subunit alcohol dehydrogenase family)